MDGRRSRAALIVWAPREDDEMYISSVRIKNFRCFRDTFIEFQPGINALIGENNSGKTTVFRALALLFDRQG